MKIADVIYSKQFPIEKHLKDIFLPTVKDIHDYAFGNVISIVNLYLPEVIRIEHHAF